MYFYQHDLTTLTALALDLDQDGAVGGILSVPGSERGEELETVALGVNLNLDAGTILGRALEGVLTSIISAGGKLEAGGGREFEGLAGGGRDRVGQGVEGEGSSECECSDEVGRGDEGVGGRVSIVTSSEVTVVRGDDCTRNAFRFNRNISIKKYTHWCWPRPS